MAPRSRRSRIGTVRIKAQSFAAPKGVCAADGQSWPCDAALLLSKIGELRRAVTLLQEHWPSTIPAPMDTPR